MRSDSRIDKDGYLCVDLYEFEVLILLMYFCEVLDALNGKTGIVECAFIKSDICGTGYFASPVELGVRSVKLVMYSYIHLLKWS